MVARIAPSPITAAVAIGDSLAHAASQTPDPPTAQPLSEEDASTPSGRRDSAQANVPAPPTAPAEAFAAAVIAGQLPPRPLTSERLRQRLGSAWQPPASPLRLMDRNA